VFAQLSDVPEGAVRSENKLDDTAQAAPPADLGQSAEQPPERLEFGAVAAEKLPHAGSPPPLAPLVPVRRPAEGPPPRALLRQTLARPETDALAGRPVALVDVLTPTRSRVQQAELIGAYWDLSAAVANYHIALGERRQLEEFTDRPTAGATVLAQSNQVLVEVALAEARIDVHESRLAAVEAQHRLAALRPLGVGDALPLPADAPHVGAYQTHFDAIFAGRPAPQARRLNDTLPIQYEAIRARAQAADRTAKLAALRLASFESGGGDVAGVLAAGERLHRQRLGFIAAVRQYNLRIAEYAGNVAVDGTDSARLVAMLIPPADVRPVGAGSAPAQLRSEDSDRSVVVQALAEEPVEPSDADEGAVQSEADAKPSKDGFVPRREPNEP
jgi:hypothetical protein